MAALASVLFLSSVTPGFAEQTDYIDVQSGVWYEDAAKALLDMGALDSSEPRLRPNDLATRAELVKLLVRVKNLDLSSPTSPSFNDVPKSSWYYEYFETAAAEGWVHGDSNCYENSRPCKARPADNVNRAEAAALLQRAFDLTYTQAAPRFPDVSINEWYARPVQTAADHCILQGDDANGRVRPSARMNRAEMVVMFHRASENLEYGKDCGPLVPADPNLIQANATMTTKVRLTFNVDLDESEAEDESNYGIRLDSSVSGNGIVIRNAVLVSNRVVELETVEALASDKRYLVTATNLRTDDNDLFSDSATFVSLEVVVTPDIVTLTVPSDRRIVLTFNVDLDSARAEEEFRYQVSDIDSTVTVNQVIQLSDRSVELRLGTDLVVQGSYSVQVTGLRTTLDNVIFSDSKAFIYNHSAVSFLATLNGTQEVPSLVSTSSGTGSFSLTETSLTYDITIRSLSGAITAAHFHLGSVGVSGDVMKPISFIGMRAQGAWTNLTDAERDAILDGRIYVNVHTAAHPNGEIRGQVVKN